MSSTPRVGDPSPDVLLIAHFSADDSSSNDRFSDLAGRIVARGLDVELVTSSFSHARKEQRTWPYGDHGFRRTLIREPGYTRNVGLKRLVSHRLMARHLRRFLHARQTPDLIYCAVPSLAVADVAARFAGEKRIPLVVDVQDLWPEAFELLSPAPAVTRPLMHPLSRTANRVYRAADAVVAVSETYARRADAVRTGSRSAHVVYLGTDLAKFDELRQGSRAADVASSSDEIRIAYVGTLGHSYDLPLVCDAIAEATQKTARRFRLVVMGDGPLTSRFQQHAEDCGVAADFVGRLPYADMVARLGGCHVAVNPIRPGAAQSVINKVGDYAAAALPVLNTQDNVEYRRLVAEYEAGVNCVPGDAKDLARHLCLLADNPRLREEMGANNRRMAEDHFDRSRTYPRVVELVLSLLGPS
nr:glycosyltransferase family 4 protein [Ornithinimicrobium sediminis]